MRTETPTNITEDIMSFTIGHLIGGEILENLPGVNGRVEILSVEHPVGAALSPRSRVTYRSFLGGEQVITVRSGAAVHIIG
jgi:hypothetical protein